MLWMILVILLILALLGAPPVTGHPYGWGPSGLLGTVLVVLLILLILGLI